MLQVKPIGAGVAGYYVGPDPERPAGRWIGSGSAALGLAGEVTGADLTSVLQGRRPATGEYLPRVRPARRRAGWDLVFSAPKSVSLLGALETGDRSVQTAHQQAVGEALGHLGRELIGERIAVICAAFDHRSNAASEPHLHTHVLLANLGRDGAGAWGPVTRTGWWTRRQELSAVYQLGVRHHLAALGWSLDWRLRPDGLADLAFVPRAAVRSTSTQRAATLADGPFETRRRAAPQPWRDRARAAGFTGLPRSPSGCSLESPALPAPETPEGHALDQAVMARLSGRRSDFRPADVFVALAAAHPGGATAGAAREWVAAFCDRSIPVSPATATRSPRWTTTLAREADRRLMTLIDQGLSVEVWPSRPGQSDLLGHAARIEVGRPGWQASGLEATVRAPTELAAARWRALTGLEAERPGSRAGIVIVDQADRRPPHELIAVLAAVRDRGARAVLIEGGTLPRLSYPASLAFAEIAGRLAGAPAPGRARSEVCERLVEMWMGRREALMVGLGVDEMRALNAGASRRLAEEGALTGPVLTAGGLEFQAGARVVALTRVDPRLPGGSTGTVRSVHVRTGEATVGWDAGVTSRLPGACLGYGYAATPALARWTRQPLMLLGEAGAVPHLRSRVIEAVAAPAHQTLARSLDHSPLVAL